MGKRLHRPRAPLTKPIVPLASAARGRRPDPDNCRNRKTGVQKQHELRHAAGSQIYSRVVQSKNGLGMLRVHITFAIVQRLERVENTCKRLPYTSHHE